MGAIAATGGTGGIVELVVDDVEVIDVVVVEELEVLLELDELDVVVLDDVLVLELVLLLVDELVVVIGSPHVQDPPSSWQTPLAHSDEHWVPTSQAPTQAPPTHDSLGLQTFPVSHADPFGAATHTDEQQSPFLWFPSSQVSGEATAPNPRCPSRRLTMS